MLNKVILIGRLTNSIELRKTNDGTQYTYFTLAVNRPGQGDKTDFISCVAWRGTAELMSKYLVKGSLIAVEGRIEVYRVEKESIETRTTINVQNVNFLDSRKTGTTTEQKVDSIKPHSAGVSFESETPKTKTSELNLDEIEF